MATSSLPLPSHHGPAQLPVLHELSSQFRKWRFSPAELDRLRHEANASVQDHALRMIAHEAKLNDQIPPQSIDFITPTEELQLVNLTCSRATLLCKVLGVTSIVRATAIMYIRRFYLYQSLINYDPVSLMATCVFLASKVENQRMDLSKLVAKCKGLIPSVIKDLEFVLSDTLQYEFWVRHPHDASLGLMLDIQSVISDLSHELLDNTWRAAREWVDRAVASDAVLLYMPAQVAMACWMAAARKTELPFESQFLPAKCPIDTFSTLLPILEAILDKINAAVPPSTEQARVLSLKRRACCNPEFNPESKTYAELAEERRVRELAEEVNPTQPCTTALPPSNVKKEVDGDTPLTTKKSGTVKRHAPDNELDDGESSDTVRNELSPAKKKFKLEPGPA